MHAWKYTFSKWTKNTKYQTLKFSRIGLIAKEAGFIPNFQIEAINALRNGIESYDRRHGWRGPITNKNEDTNWKKKLENFNIDPTLQWKKAEVTGMNDNFLILKTKNIN